MNDRIPGAPGQYKATVTAAEFQKLQAGEQFNIVLVRDDQPIVEGTPYSKAAVLPEALGKVICPDIADPTPADAFRELLKMTSPYNLLDNSDFRNPVNQRGLSVYEAGSIRYTIDRWRAMSRNTVKVPDAWGDGDGNSGYGSIIIKNTSTTQTMGFAQYLPDEKVPNAGDMITVACADNYGTVYCGSAAMPKSGYTKVVSIGNAAHISVYAQSEGARVTFIVQPDSSIQLNWVALYAGAYTADTLPAYRPKGYAAELMECMRYYQICSKADVAAVDLRPTMRLSSPTITEVDGGYAYSADL